MPTRKKTATAELTVHEAIKQVRKKLGLSQQVLATDLGIGITTLVQYEKRWRPPLELLIRFAAMARKADDPDLTKFLDQEVGDAVARVLKEYPLNLYQVDLINWVGMLMVTARGQEECMHIMKFRTAFNDCRSPNPEAAKTRRACISRTSP